MSEKEINIQDIEEVKTGCYIEKLGKPDCYEGNESYWLKTFSKNDENLLNYSFEMYKKINELIKAIKQLDKKKDENANSLINIEILEQLEKRAKQDLENNTHSIGQEEVITIIREFIRCKTDLEILQDDIKDKNIIYTDTPEFEENYIPRKKIEEKIKKFKKGINNLDTYENFSEHDVVEAIIEILEQLLKEKI